MLEVTRSIHMSNAFTTFYFHLSRLRSDKSITSDGNTSEYEVNNKKDEEKKEKRQQMKMDLFRYGKSRIINMK